MILKRSFSLLIATGFLSFILKHLVTLLKVACLGTAPGYLQDLEKSQPPGTNCSACAGCVKDISEATARFNACWQVNAERKETDFRI